MTNKKENTYIIFILDKSGSMSAIQDATIKNTNEFFDEQKKILTEAKVSSDQVKCALVTFNSRVEKLFENKRVTEVPTLVHKLSSTGHKLLNSVLSLKYAKVEMNEIKLDPTKEVNYIPDGTTALYDAIGDTVSKTQ